MTISAILFDKDGTLFQFGATWEAWASAFLLRATEGDNVRAIHLGKAIGFDLPAGRFRPDSVVIAGTPAEVADALVPHLPHMARNAVIDMLNEEAEMAPQAEAVPLLPYLQALRAQGMRLGVATNDAESPARAHLNAAGVAECFDFVAGFDSGHGAKPAPGQLLAFSRAVNVPPAHVVMVGDSTHDLRAGRSAGMTTVGVLTGMARADELDPFADVVLPDIGHLPRWLGL
ncbi:HAD family hydrolase [Sedimentitalea todarodis]|uniref:phosphoglycolate phosphatase n=1 Tax=Sedimentitalea todarodis TaxID=1631240 RepID=A0ABU3VB32_9RHOB|nr:HAD family hydrolase [Sedimentitalea todarodis]MDU9003390.1 HAD family hydrolase [Sedimentitalea todarodis]